MSGTKTLTEAQPVGRTRLNVMTLLTTRPGKLLPKIIFVLKWLYILKMLNVDQILTNLHHGIINPFAQISGKLDLLNSISRKSKCPKILF